MDILTQGLLGAAASQAVFGRRLPRAAAIIGLVAGILADADVLIRPASDPLSGLTYHRHFTHALAFIPIGALLAALPFFLVRSLREHRLLVYLTALTSYATHGLLDACTSYGTMLGWPFTDERFAWDFISIIDPAFTVPLIIGLLIAWWRTSPVPARVALCAALLYMTLGMVQRDRVLSVQRQLAAMRGHTIERGRALPSPLSLVLWRSVYVTPDDRLVADGIRINYAGDVTVRTGSSMQRLSIEEVRSLHADDPQLIAGFERFHWFTDGYTGRHDEEPQVIGDMRYGQEPHTFSSLWGYLMVPPDASATNHRMVSFGIARSDRIERVWDSLMGRDPEYLPLEQVMRSE